MARPRTLINTKTRDSKLIFDPIVEIAVVIFLASFLVTLPYYATAPILFTITVSMTVIGVAGLAMLALTKRAEFTFKLSFKDMEGILNWAIIGLFGCVLGFALARVLGLGFLPASILASTATGDPWFMIIFYPFVSVPEEIFFRAFLMKTLHDFLKFFIGEDLAFIFSNIGTSTIFTLYHGVTFAGNMVGLLGVFIASLALGATAYYSKHLSASMLAHAGNNTLTVVTSLLFGV